VKKADANLFPVDIVRDMGGVEEFNKIPEIPRKLFKSNLPSENKLLGSLD